MLNDPTGADYYAYEQDRELYAGINASKAAMADYERWARENERNNQLNAGTGSSGPAVYSGSGSQSPDAWNIMGNFSNGIENSIATGLRGDVPVGAYKNYTLEAYGYYVVDKATGKIVRNVVEGYSKSYKEGPGEPGDPPKWVVGFQHLGMMLRDMVGLGNNRVGFYIVGPGGQKTYVDYANRRPSKDGVIGILNLSDPTNPLSIMSLIPAGNELDALNGVWSVWDSDPLNQYLDNDGKYDRLYLYQESLSYPGYYEYNFGGPGVPQYLYDHIYRDGVYQMKPIKKIN